MAMKIDPVTLDIVKDSLIAVSNEVFYAFARTSMSPIIYETLDYASGIADADGSLLTQGNGACAFIGLIAPMIQEIVQKFGKEQMKPGDVYLINDPYMGGGTHLSDIGMVMPVFYDGEIVAFVGNKAHWSDIGGMASGSFTTDSTEVFQEGLRFSGVKLVDGRGALRPARRHDQIERPLPRRLGGRHVGPDRLAAHRLPPYRRALLQIRRRGGPGFDEAGCSTRARSSPASVWPRCPTASGRWRSSWTTTGTATPSKSR